MYSMDSVSPQWNGHTVGVSDGRMIYLTYECSHNVKPSASVKSMPFVPVISHNANGKKSLPLTEV